VDGLQDSREDAYPGAYPRRWQHLAGASIRPAGPRPHPQRAPDRRYGGGGADEPRDPSDLDSHV